MTKRPFGLLILHGFTASLDGIRGVESALSALAIPMRIPVLRGHGAESPAALRGVTWPDWVGDANSAFNDLLSHAEKVIVFGHSMGGLVALNLAADHPQKIDSLIVAAAAIQATSPLAPGNSFGFLLQPLTPILRLIIRKITLAPTYADPALNASHTNYPWAPVDAILSFFHFTQVTRQRLPEVNLPLLIMHSHNDSVIDPKSAKIIYTDVTTPAAEKRLVWFDKTEHEMFRDCERDATTGAVVAYVQERIAMQQA